MSPTLRVLHIVPITSDGQMPPFVKSQLVSLQEVGVESEVLPVEGSAVPLAPRAILSEITRVRTVVRTQNPDIVHAHWGSFLALAAAIGASGRPLVITYRGSDLNPTVGEGRVRGRLRNLLSMAAATRAAAIVTVSRPLARRLGRRGIAAHIVPDGVDLEIFRPADKRAARRSLGWSDSEPVVFLYQGGRPEAKGRPLADAALRSLHGLGIDCRLEVIDGGFSREEVALRLNASDCVLMLSPHEGSPNIVREAIACGVPVVGVDVGDVRQWVDQTPWCHLVSRDPVSVAGAIRAVLCSPGDSGRTSVPDGLDVGASRDALLMIYQDVLRGARSSPQGTGQ